MKGIPSTKKSIACRRNGRRSTGPKTPEGKAASSMNATKHGLTASELFMEDDLDLSLDDYKESLLKAFKPKGPVEEELVAKITAQWWRLRRVNKAETEYLVACKRSDNGKPPQAYFFPTKFKGLESLGRYERTINRNLQRDIDFLRKLQEDRKAPMLEHNWTAEQHLAAFSKLRNLQRHPKLNEQMARPVAYDWAEETEDPKTPTTKLDPWFHPDTWPHDDADCPDPSPPSRNASPGAAPAAPAEPTGDPRRRATAQPNEPAALTTPARATASKQSTGHTAAIQATPAGATTRSDSEQMPPNTPRIQNPKSEIQNRSPEYNGSARPNAAQPQQPNPTEPARPIELTNRTQPANSTELARPIELADPTELAAPTGQADSIEPANQTEPANPTEPPNSTELARPIEPANLTELAAPTGQADSIEPANQTEPANPIEPPASAELAAPTELADQTSGSLKGCNVEAKGFSPGTPMHPEQGVLKGRNNSEGVSTPNGHPKTEAKEETALEWLEKHGPMPAEFYRECARIEQEKAERAKRADLI